MGVRVDAVFAHHEKGRTMCADDFIDGANDGACAGEIQACQMLAAARRAARLVVQRLARGVLHMPGFLPALGGGCRASDAHGEMRVCAAAPAVPSI